MSAAEMLHRLERATNIHDLDELVDCFATDYVNETPAHPARGFRGREQVRSNWAQIFAGVPDLRASVRRWIADSDTVWSEWEMSGTRRDGVEHLMRGVIIFEVKDGRATAAQFYLEPVDRSTDDVNTTVRDILGRPS
jgi:ketosteroid isomerase-like protein